MASTGRVTWKPCSCACLAVDSTPLLVAMPTMTTCVTSSSRRRSVSAVPEKALRAYFVTMMSSGC